jgi:Cap4 SAVED domain
VPGHSLRIALTRIFIFADRVITPRGWLPEFALKHSELTDLNTGNAVQLVRDAAKRVYESKKFENRGEFGELFLHAAIRQVFDSLPAISKIYYETARNDTAKGFDAVHVVVSPANELELWLGEAKFYNEVTRAVWAYLEKMDTDLGSFAIV